MLWLLHGGRLMGWGGGDWCGGGGGEGMVSGSLPYQGDFLWMLKFRTCPKVVLQKFGSHLVALDRRHRRMQSLWICTWILSLVYFCLQGDWMVSYGGPKFWLFFQKNTVCIKWPGQETGFSQYHWKIRERGWYSRKTRCGHLITDLIQ